MIRLASNFSTKRYLVSSNGIARCFSNTSSLSKSAAVDDMENECSSQFMLILGKPGGGKVRALPYHKIQYNTVLGIRPDCNMYRISSFNI